MESPGGKICMTKVEKITVHTIKMSVSKNYLWKTFVFRKLGKIPERSTRSGVATIVDK